MEVNITEKKLKPIVKEILIEMLQKKNSELIKVIEETIEEIGLSNAIEQGRKNDFVSKNEIFDILDIANEN